MKRLQIFTLIIFVDKFHRPFKNLFFYRFDADRQLWTVLDKRSWSLLLSWSNFHRLLWRHRIHYYWAILLARGLGEMILERLNKQHLSNEFIKIHWLSLSVLLAVAVDIPSSLYTLNSCLYTLYSCLYTLYSCLYTLFSCLYTFKCKITMRGCLMRFQFI